MLQCKHPEKRNNKQGTAASHTEVDPLRGILFHVLNMGGYMLEEGTSVQCLSPVPLFLTPQRCALERGVRGPAAAAAAPGHLAEMQILLIQTL